MGEDRSAIEEAGDHALLAALNELFDGARIAANRWLGGMLVTAGAVSLLLNRVLPQRHAFLPDEDTSWSMASLQARALASLCGVRVSVRGLGRLLQGGPFIFVANHESFFDIVALLGFLPGRKRFVATPECFRDRYLGLALRVLGICAVDAGREEQTLVRLRSLIEGGVSAIVFPEGRRGRGGRLLPFKAFPFGAAIRLGAPVVPVAIRGTRGVLPRGSGLGVRPGRIEIVIEEPIPTAALIPDDTRPLRADVFGAISRNVEEVAMTEDQDGSAAPVMVSGGMPSCNGVSAV